ncbi:hypothetical protein NQ317_017787 [Molorchus minor]|uniref:Uncharacterized protein n=1 Tax=Molorchus minor TaxID=1323400 RepID=A0ABQ9K2C5_9CUCU|nr:hypothetical protein NQ317_017787 [Molorchus minor]
MKDDCERQRIIDKKKITVPAYCILCSLRNDNYLIIATRKSISFSFDGLIAYCWPLPRSSSSYKELNISLTGNIYINLSPTSPSSSTESLSSSEPWTEAAGVVTLLELGDGGSESGLGYLSSYTHDSQVSPIQHVAQALRSVPLDDPLPSVQPGKLVHVLRQLPDAVFQRDKTAVHDVDTVRHRISNVFLHETAKP